MKVVAAAILGALLLILLGAGRLLLVPVRPISRVVVRSLLGLVLLFILNLAVQSTGLCVGVNPVTMLIAGYLGVPGMALLVVLRYVMA